MSQKRCAIMSNAGGTGKSTLVVNLAYQLARKGLKVCMFGCDPNGSLTLFAGLDDPLDADQTLDKVLKSDFDGQWPLFPVWTERTQSVDACLGGLVLTQTSKRLDQELRGPYLLADALEDYPLPHDILLFDCPGTIERFHEVALAASTDIVLVLRPEDKDIDAFGKLVDWIYQSSKALRVKPSLLGVLPNGYKRDRAMHRDNLGSDPERSLPIALKQMGLPMFSPIRDSAYLANAGANGLPLGIHRPGEEINQIFESIADALIEAS